MRHWIVGYGSLICSDSRSRSGVSGEAFPIHVRGLERSWGYAIVDSLVSAVGVRRNDKKGFSGVLFEVDEENLRRFDVREAPHGYNRVCLDASYIAHYGSGDIPQGDYWVYVIGEGGPDLSSSFSTIQSYLDVILPGCQELAGEGFARSFIRTTCGWNEMSWIDDRVSPLYPRPAVNPPIAWIDRILAEEAPKAFRSRIVLSIDEITELRSGRLPKKLLG